jgi:hypothetical protein
MTRSDMLFIAEMSAKYHRRRAAFLERAGKAMSITILVGGAGAFASLYGANTIFAQAATACVALIGIIQIVTQTDRCAANHSNWLREWNRMLVEINQTPDPTAQQLAAWNAKRYDLESECVGEMRALQEDCYNRTMAALDRDGVPTKITRWQRLWMQLFSFENAFQRQSSH